MKIDDLPGHFRHISAEIERAIRDDIPRIVANRAVMMYKQNFQQQGFFGQRWQDVKRRTHPTKSQMGKASTTRPILTGTGNLGRSIQADVQPGKVIIHSDLPYASAHNEGTNNAGRSHNVHIPQRQFIGPHPQIDRLVTDTITQQIEKIFS